MSTRNLKIDGLNEGGPAKHGNLGFGKLSPPAFFSRRESRASSAYTEQSPSPTILNDASQNPTSVEAARSKNAMKRNQSDHALHASRKEFCNFLKSKNFSRSMPCLSDTRVIRSLYNRSIGKSVQVTDEYCEDPLYDQWFTKLELLDEDEDHLSFKGDAGVLKTVDSISPSCAGISG
jgi:hypothetical protein